MRKPVFLACLLLAGCRSEQVVFQFQPGAAASVVTAKAPAAGSPDTTALVVAHVAPAALPASRPTPARQSQLIRVKPALPPFAAAMSKQVARLARHLGRRPTTEGAAESGLGRVALFFIGVVLAVLAGLATLVNVIFGVGFFTALGYAAGGLVVLGLLYLLLSSGKKKA